MSSVEKYYLLQGNGGLRVFNISWNGFALDSCMILGQSLKDNTMLRELDISHNGLDTAAMGGILKGVQGNETLTTLRVSLVSICMLGYASAL